MTGWTLGSHIHRDDGSSTSSKMWMNFYKTTYIVQSIISWTGSIVALLCTTADMWSHEMMPCPFFSCTSKKQLRECGVFRKKVTVVKGSCLRAAEIENVAVWAMGKRQVLPLGCDPMLSNVLERPVVSIFRIEEFDAYKFLQNSGDFLPGHHSLTHGAEPFLRSCQLCSYSRTSQHFMEPGGSLPCSQEPSTGPYLPGHVVSISVDRVIFIFISPRTSNLTLLNLVHYLTHHTPRKGNCSIS
jgi:hypothetical protein